MDTTEPRKNDLQDAVRSAIADARAERERHDRARDRDPAAPSVTRVRQTGEQLRTSR